MMQIATECDVRYNDVSRCVRKLRIKGIKINAKYYFNKYQQDVIHENLYFEMKTDTLTLESKMNG